MNVHTKAQVRDALILTAAVVAGAVGLVVLVMMLAAIGAALEAAFGLGAC